jgi:hypothetical protein
VALPMSSAQTRSTSSTGPLLRDTLDEDDGDTLGGDDPAEFIIIVGVATCP